MRRLVVGMWTRHLLPDTTENRANRTAYTEAAHIGLSAIGVPVPAAPFGLTLIITEAVLAAGPQPSSTQAFALPIWREQLTDAIVAKLLES